jgi:hypothetical protein
MRTYLLIFAVLLMGSAGACHQEKSPLADGCYYTDGQPVFTITRGKGTLLVPGAAKHFTAYVSAGDAVFEPGFLFDGAAPDIHAHDDVPGPREYPLIPGAGPPKIRMYWAAYGDSEVSRGKPCSGTAETSRSRIDP